MDGSSILQLNYTVGIVVAVGSVMVEEGWVTRE